MSTGDIDVLQKEINELVEKLSSKGDSPKVIEYLSDIRNKLNEDIDRLEHHRNR
jgi:hypothetical protein